MYSGSVTVPVTEIVKLENAIVKGDLIITGASSVRLSFTNITVEGDLVLADFDGNVDFEGITVVGDTVI